MKKARTLLAIWLALILTLTLFPTALAVEGDGTDPGSTPTTQLTISFDNNGGHGKPTDRKSAPNISFEIPANEMTRPGFTFKGWKVEGDENLYQPGATYQLKDADVTFVAQWEARTDMLDITFSSEDGTSDMPQPRTAEPHSSFEIPKNQVSRPGFTFKGWKVDGDENLYQPGATYQLKDADVTFVAQWEKEASKITVQFAKENNSGRVSGMPLNTEVPADQKYQLPTKEPSRTDGSYEFGRWKLNFNGKTYTYSAGATIDWASIGVEGGDTVTFIADFDHHTYADYDEDNDKPSKPSKPTYDEYRIRATCSDGGWVSPAGSSYVREGRNLTVTFAPYKGYAIDGVYIDGVLDNRYDGSYTFRDVDENHTIYVRYVRDSGSSGGSSGGGSHWDDNTSPKTGDASAPLSMGLGVGSLALIAFLVARKMRRA